MLPGSIAGGIREKKRPAGTRLAHLGPVCRQGASLRVCRPQSSPAAWWCSPARARWLLDFHARMRAIQRCGGFTKRAIRQKNGADALYTLYTEHAL